MKSIQEVKFIDSIESLRLPLAVMVVCIHAHVPNHDNYAINCLSHVMTHIAVPIFFVMSGFLFFHGIEEWSYTKWKEKIKKRIRSLVVPYILWITLFVIYKYILSSIFHYRDAQTFLNPFSWLNEMGGVNIYWDSEVWNTDKTTMFGLDAKYTAPMLIPFWFIRDIIVCIAFTPCFYIILKERSNTSKIIARSALLLFGFLFLGSNYIIQGMGSLSMLFFGFGAYLKINNLEPYKIMHVCTSWLIIVLSIGLLLVDTYYDGLHTTLGDALYKPYILFGVVSWLIIHRYFYVKYNKVCLLFSKYSRDTFFIFAFHGFIITFVQQVILRFTNIITPYNLYFDIECLTMHPYISTVVYILTVVFTVAICICLNRIFVRLLPCFSKLFNCK